MTPPVSTRFTYGRDEYILAMRRHYRSTLQWKRDAVGGVLAIAGGLGLYLATDTSIGWIGWFLVGAGVLLLALVAFAILWLPAIIYASQPKLKNEYDLFFSDEGIRFQTCGIDATLRWSVYHSWLADEQFYILYHGKRDLTVIPRRALANTDADDALRLLLTAHIGQPRDYGVSGKQCPPGDPNPKGSKPLAGG